MQDALSAFVLNSETLPRKTMSETPATATNSSAQAEPQPRGLEVLRTRAGKVKDVLEVEEEMARVRGEVEPMEAEQKTLEHRVEFAIIDMKLAEEYKARLNTPARLRS